MIDSVTWADVHKPPPPRRLGGSGGSGSDAGGSDELDGSDDESKAAWAGAGAGALRAKEPPLFWAPMYGAPHSCTDKGNAARMNRYGSTEGSTYRGRLLLSLRTVDEPDSDEEEFSQAKPIDGASWLRNGRLPKTVRYTLRCFVGRGLDIPSFHDLAHGASKMHVRVSVGEAAVLSFGPGRRKGGGGQVLWEDTQEAVSIDLPASLTSIPDIIVHLCRTTTTGLSDPVCFCRVPAAELYHERFRGRPAWHSLAEDKTRANTFSALDPERFPGSLLLRLGFGRDEWARSNAWKPPPSTFGRDAPRLPYQLRVHVCQARDLPPAGSTGHVDPYVLVRFNGEAAQRTKQKRHTSNPSWYGETLATRDQCLLSRASTDSRLLLLPVVSLSLLYYLFVKGTWTTPFPTCCR